MSLAVLMIPRGTGDVATAVLSAPFKGTNVDSVGGGRDNEGTDGGADGGTDGGIDGVVQLSIEVNDAEAVLSASHTHEPQWVARSWCKALALGDSAEGLPCTRMLAEEFIAKGGRYEVPI